LALLRNGIEIFSLDLVSRQPIGVLKTGGGLPMTFRAYTLRSVSIGLAFFIWIVASSGHGQTGTLLSKIFIVSGLGSICLLALLVPILNYVKIYKNTISLHEVVSFKVPGSFQMNLHGQWHKISAVAVYFQDVSPECVEGKIWLSSAEETAANPSFHLEQPKTSFNYFTNRKATDAWPRRTGRSRWPIFIKNDGTMNPSNLNFELKWNFEGTYLERLLPRSRNLTVEVFVYSLKHFNADGHDAGKAVGQN
jgi:hypothetical protein